MVLKLYVFTDSLKAFRHDYGKLVRKDTFTFIWTDRQLHGHSPKETLVLKKIYGVRQSKLEKDQFQEIQYFIDQRQFNVIEL